MFSIEMFPAYIGDALWIEYGDADRPSRVLIDGGLVGTAEKLRERIEAVAEKEGRCRLDLLVISHVDADHIEGIIKLLGDSSLPLDVDDVWFNGSSHLPDPEGKDDDEFLGARQGEFLSALLEARELPWNEFMDGKTIYVPPETRGSLPKTTLKGGMEIVLLSPTYAKLVDLSGKWEDEVHKAGLDGASLDEVLSELQHDRRLGPDDDDDFLSSSGPPDVEDLLESAEKSDHSAANGSSIAFLASFDDRVCLFSADAHSDVLEAGIDRLLAERGDDRLALTAFKLAHHGSQANLSEDLLDRIDCERFLVSTNSRRFHHPDPEAMARVVGGPWRGPDALADDEIELIFNYRTDETNAWDDPDLRKRWNYRTVFPSEDEAGVVVNLGGDTDRG